MVRLNARLALLVPLAASLSLACGPSSKAPLSSQDSIEQGLTSAPSLGTSAAFSVLAGQTVTNTGPTVMDANLGVSPGSAVTGFPPGLVTPPATMHVADAVALQAESDVTTAYNALAGAACNADRSGVDLGGLTLVSGVYCFTSGAQLTGALTLDAQGDPNAVFIFQIASTLTTASASSVLLINGAKPCNVFWQVGSSATIGTTTTFVGNILALTSIALQTGATVDGRALARNGAVTLDSNQIRTSQCNGSGGGGPPDTTPPGCALTAVISGPPKQLKITVQDTGSGLNSVVVIVSTNANTTVPAFTSGSTGALVVTATKINQSSGAQVGLRVTDVAGNVTLCDPLLAGETPAPQSSGGCSTGAGGLFSLLGLVAIRRRRRRLTP